jgi:hypothetical protein
MKERAVAIRIVLILSLSAVSSFGIAESADASGTYDVYSCRTPAGDPGETAPWLSMPGPSGSVFDRCDEGGSLGAAVASGPVTSTAHTGWQFDAPPYTELTRVVLYRQARAVTGPGWTKAYELFRDSVALDPRHMLDECAPWPPSNCTAVGDPANPFSPANRVEIGNLQAHRLILTAICIGPSSCPATGSLTGEIRVFQSVVTLVDEQSPAFTGEPSGPLLRDGARLSGVQTAYYSASDAGGGLYRASIAVDGHVSSAQPVANAGRTCAPRTTAAVPCPQFASGSYSVDTARLPDGDHTVQLVLADVAGNQTFSRPVRVRIRNHAVPNGFGASPSAVITAGFDGRATAARRTRYAAAPTITGLLRRHDGFPIAAAVVAVLSRSSHPGAHLREVARVRTDTRGRFSYRVRRGPSRLFRLTYRAYDLDTADAAHADLHLGVRAGVTLDIRPRRVRNGHRIVFRGALKGGPGRPGTLVTMQELDPRPLTFQTLRVHRDGRFRGSYRFRYTYHPTRFRFRALVQRQAGYPYLTGSSRAVAVVVRP